MKETPEKLQWHPAFYAATELELRENYDDLEFEPFDDKKAMNY